VAAKCWAFFNWVHICHLSLFIHICPARNFVEREVTRSAYRCDAVFQMFPCHHCDTFICFMTKIVTRLLLYKPTENLVILWTDSKVLKRRTPKQRKTANSIRCLKFVCEGTVVRWYSGVGPILLLPNCHICGSCCGGNVRLWTYLSPCALFGNLRFLELPWGRFKRSRIFVVACRWR